MDIELNATVDGMISDNQVDKLKAEYAQLNIRLNRLNKIIQKIQDNDIKFHTSTNIELLKAQAGYMDAYMSVLRDRAATEGIKL